MRAFLLVLIVLEAVALFVAGGALLFGIEDHKAELPDVQAFRPPIHDAAIGDYVRYRRLDKSGDLIGFLEYKVEMAEVFSGTNFGRTFRVLLIERDAGGREQRRQRLIVRPRDVTHGFLPPRIDEDVRAQVPGELLVVASIETASVTIKRRVRRGFLVQAIVPRDSTTKIAERFWIHRSVPIFGVARWERRDETYVVDRMEITRS